MTTSHPDFAPAVLAAKPADLSGGSAAFDEAVAFDPWDDPTATSSTQPDARSGTHHGAPSGVALMALAMRESTTPSDFDDAHAPSIAAPAPVASAPAADSPEALTPGQLRRRWAERKRMEAARAGTPIERMRQSPMPFGAPMATFVYLHGGLLLEVDLTLDGVHLAASEETVQAGSYVSLPSQDGSVVAPVAPARPARQLTMDRLADLVGTVTDYPVSVASSRMNMLEPIQSLAGQPPARPRNFDEDDLAAVRAYAETCARGILFADKASFMAAKRLAEAAVRSSFGIDTDDARRNRATARILNHRADLPTSTIMPILTESLALKYWMPLGLDEKNLSSWVGAFGLGESPLPVQVSTLLARALTGPRSALYSHAMMNAEKWGAIAARSGSSFKAARAFRESNSFKTAFEALCYIDPLLVDYYSFTGEVARLTIVKDSSGFIGARVSEPFKMKVDERVLLFEPHHAPDSSTGATIGAMEYNQETGALMVSFKKGTRRNEPWENILGAARANRRVMYAMKQPYIPSGPGTTLQGTWSRPMAPEVPRPTRDVPIDVVLAGAPNNS